MSAHTIIGSRANYLLSVEATTSTLEEHSSFDFETVTHEFSQLVRSAHTFSLSHKYVYVFRNEQSTHGEI
jgi:hypothetical protein